MTPEGFLVVEGVPIARIGEMEYGSDEVPGIDPGDDGIIRMSRTPEELFSEETIASFEGKPLIIPTGDVHTSGIDADTWSDYAAGHIQGVRKSGDFLVADIVINDASAIERVNQGLRELSCGYEYLARQTSKGHGEQYEIRGNHVALVDKARGGSQLKIGDMGQIMKIKNPLLRLFAHAVKAGDEEAQKDIEEKLGEESEEKAGDEGDVSAAKIEALEAKLDKLIDVVSALTSAKAGDEDEDDEESAGDEDDEEANKAGDAEWQEVISGAAILAPHLTVAKKGKIGDAKAKVLAAIDSAQVKRIIGDSAPAKLGSTALNIAFASAVEVQKSINNAKMTTGDGSSAGLTFSGQNDGGFEVMRKS